MQSRLLSIEPPPSPSRGGDLAGLLQPPFNAPKAIKLDVDGIELSILKGLGAVLAADGLRHIMVEESAAESRIGVFLRNFGFVQIDEEPTNLKKPGKNLNRYFSRST